MAWTATIKQKGIVDKAFLVNVAYSNGTNSFNEVIDMTGGDMATLSQKVSSRLATLEAVQTLAGQVTVGPFTPTTPAVHPQTAFMGAVRHFESCKRAVDLGLILATDPIYTDAEAAAKAAYDPSFIDLL